MFVLVIGGAGSGKSAYAEQLAVALAGNAPKAYLATMQVWDAECRARIVRHRNQRAGKSFRTVECSNNLSGLEAPILDRCGTILLEDLGNLAANELYAPGADLKSVWCSIVHGVEHLMAVSRHLVIVSNEIGIGSADYAEDTVRYLRLLARLHRDLALRADAVCEVTAGLPFYYKGRNPL